MKKLLIIFTLLLSSYCYSNFTYESNQSLIDLRNESSVTNLSSGDDQTSAMFPIGFNFSFYGETFTQARMATNGCLHFLANDTTCNDYTPDPLPYATYTMYPFWTDLVGGTMKAKSYDDKTVFGWYNKKEYNRTSSNSFEVILYPNSSFEYRYGELDVNKHDVLIGHQGTVLETYTHLFHDECSTGSTNAANCNSLDWNEHFNNTILENGGSLYTDKVNSGSYVDPCIENVLYSNYCAGYWEAYDDLQCREDPQYAPSCAGYSFEQDVGYYVEETIFFDYGFQQYSNNGNQQSLDFYPDTMYNSYEPELYREESYLMEIYYTDVEEQIEYERYNIENIIPVEEFLQTLTYDEIIIPETREPYEEMQEFFPEILQEDGFFIAAEGIDDEEIFEETLLEEILQEDSYEEEEENFNNSRPESGERIVDRAERVEEVFEINSITEKSSVRISALSVVSSTINTANNSVSGTDSGNSIHASGNTVNSGGVSSIGFDNGLNFSNLTSVSGQFNIGFTDSSQSSSVETTVSVSTNSIDTNQSNTNLDTTIVSNENNSEADKIADGILAKNIATAQEESIEEQKSTGQYGEEDNIISFINYNPAFNNYRAILIPNKDEWYAIKSIYIGNSIQDNNLAFYKLSSDSLNGLTKLKELQPNL